MNFYHVRCKHKIQKQYVHNCISRCAIKRKIFYSIFFLSEVLVRLRT